MIHHPNYCNSYSSGLFVLKYICEKLFKPGNIETTWRPQSYCSYWGWFENNDFAGCPRASKKDGNMARSTATLKTWESHVWVAKIGSRILRSWIVWFQESSEFASSSDTFSYEQCPVEPLLACGGSSPHLKDSGTDQLTKTMTFWTYGLFLYLYHIRGWYDVCNNMYIVRMNIHPTTIFGAPRRSDCRPCHGHRRHQPLHLDWWGLRGFHDVWVRTMFIRFVKITCMYFDSKKDQDTVY